MCPPVQFKKFETKGAQIEVQCYRDLNLLAHAQLEELEIGSRCGGHGVCGGDKILIQNGQSLLSSVTDAERKHLTSAEIQAGWRLGCQSWPNADDLEVLVLTKEVKE